MKKFISAVIAVCMLVSLFAPAFAAEQTDPKISVISDIHYFPEEYIGDLNGFNYRRTVDNDLKLEQYADEIIDEAIDRIIANGSKIVFIPGDNAMGCEYLSHEMLTKKLGRLTENGIAVYTIPGNHDISRPDKISKKFVVDDPSKTVVKAGNTYVDDEIVEVRGTTKSEFAKLYSDFGYGDNQNVIARDSGGSLSYTAKIADGYRLIAVDANEYDGELCTGKKSLDGNLLEWVCSQIEECTQAGDVPLMMMHFGLIEKYGMQSLIMGGNFLDDGEKLAERFADLGVQYIFTGHSHANDIASVTTKSGNTVYEICTGSLAMHGSPIRHLNFSGSDCEIRTEFPDSIKGIEDYQAFCRDYYYNGGVRTIMRNRAIFDVTDAVAGLFKENPKAYNAVYDFFLELMTMVIDTLLATPLDSGVTVEAMLTAMYKYHYAGDEIITGDMNAATDKLLSGSAFETALDIVFTSLSVVTGLENILKFNPLHNSAIDEALEAVMAFIPAKILGIIFGEFCRGIFIDTYPADNNINIVGGMAYLPDGTPCTNNEPSVLEKIKYYLSVVI